MKPFFAIAVLASAVAIAPAYAQEETQTGRIMVTGQGTSELAPDMAVLTLGVVQEAETAREALSANNTAMAEVLASMSDAGIEERDLQTSNFNITPLYERRKGSLSSDYSPEISGYRVSNTLTVRVRDLDGLGEIIDRSVTLGVNQGGQVQFTNDDPTPALEEARIAAMENAMRKAEILTQTAGASVGRVLEITEQSNRPGPIPIARAEMATMAASAPAVPMASGENSYSVMVNVTFEIDQP